MAEFGEALSDREIDVLRCIAEGLTNKEAAESLHISPYTVKTHLRNIYAKLGASSRTEATLVGMEKGFIVVPGLENEPPPAVEPDPEITSQPTIEQAPETSNQQTSQAETQATSRPNWLAIGLGVLLLVVIGGGGWLWQNGRSTPQQITTFEERALGNNWAVTSPFDTPRSNMATVTIGPFIYEIGGQDGSDTIADVIVVDTNSGTVSVGSAMSTAVSSPTAAVLYGEIYVAGGQTAAGDPTRAVEVYSPSNDGWLPIASLPQPLYGSLLVADEDAGTLYLFGGHDGETAVSTVYTYDLDQDSWLKLPDMPAARVNAAGGLVNDTIYIVGGEGENGALKSCVQFSLESQTWTSCAEMMMARADGAAVSFISKLYVFGGQIGSADGQIIAEVYDPTTDSWTPILGPTELEAVQSWTGLGVGLVETRIYATSGQLDDQFSTEAYIYSPLSNRIFLPSSATGE